MARWIAPLLMAVTVIWAPVWSDPVVAQAGFEFNPNPPSKRHDYYSSAREDRRQIKTAENHHWDRALKHLEAGQYLYAHKNLDFILRYVPNHPQALMKYSRLAMKRGKPQSAEQYLDFALKFNPQSASTYIVYGIHHYRTGDYQAAIKRFRQALERDPNNAQAHYNLGLMLVKTRDWDEARKHAHQAYALGYPLPGLRQQLKDAGHWKAPQASN